MKQDDKLREGAEAPPSLNKRDRVITISKEKHTYDHVTGQQEVTSQEYTRVVESHRFIQVYLEDMSVLMGIKTKGELRVLIILWEMAEYNSNKIILIKDTKEDIAKRTGYSYGGVNNSITRLLKEKIIFRRNTSVYYINPKYFFKGTTSNRKKCFDVLIKYELVSKLDMEK